jgi:NADH-quinone oxidoreductase subunit L
VVHLAYLMLLLPLAGFLFLLTFGRRIGDPVAGVIGTVAIGGAFVVACIVLAGLLGLPDNGRVVVDNYFTWFSAGGLSVPVGTLVDPLSMTMCMFITFVSAFIHLYSIGYMKDDRDYSKFFIYLNLFVFSMLLLVLADNLILTFVGWEGVGVCSYWLVAFWFQRESAASAGKKAFIYNRIGDVGFLLAIFLIFERTGTIQYESGPGGGVFGQLHHLDGGAGLAAVLLLFLAAAGKSAQIPLFNWLPDAMEGPTPVSALIHAATMVTAGVYLLCRMNPLLHVTATGSEIIAIIGAVTAFVAATIACAQQDIKKVLAFSTVSQIGYMILAVGTGAYIAAVFLMVAHAFFKGLLFLGAGSVIHGLEDEQDLKRMGALRRYMKWTTVTFTIGFLAIAGIPPLSGFWAKGDVLDNTFAHFKWLWVIGLVTAVLTAYYMSRLEILAFGGKERFDKEGPHGEPALPAPHESPWIMRLPLVVLAFFAFFAGALDLPWVHSDNLASFLAPVFAGTLYNDNLGTGPEWELAIADIAAAFIGVIVAWWLWRGDDVYQPKLEPAFLQRVWYWDDFYDTVIGRPAQRLATFLAWVVDVRIIDGAVNGTAHLAKATGNAARKLQTGYVRNYALGIALGMALIIAFMLSRTWWG